MEYRVRCHHGVVSTATTLRTQPAALAHKVRDIFEALSEWRQRTSLPIGAIGAKIRLGNTAREQQFQARYLLRLYLPWPYLPWPYLPWPYLPWPYLL